MYFALFMVIILAVTGLVCLLDWAVLSKKRAGNDSNSGEPWPVEPWYVEYSKSFFPVILVVFVVRSFLVEPFKIPSGSMMPTLLAGDYILVNKYVYGIRLPILNNTMVKMGAPKRGDVFVFHYPPEPSIDYIKRVVGLPGDSIQYQDKRLTINGKALDTQYKARYDYVLSAHDEVGAEREINVSASHLQEQLGTVKHDILNHDLINQYEVDSLGDKLMRGEAITVPAGHYFAMGDNRDNSSDSRVWGFVPEHNLVGKAFFIWFNAEDAWSFVTTLKHERIGQQIK
jgi:signal peptidase I